MKAEPSLPFPACGAHETGGWPGHVLGGDAVLHVPNRTRSGSLCKRGPDALQLLR